MILKGWRRDKNFCIYSIQWHVKESDFGLLHKFLWQSNSSLWSRWIINQVFLNPMKRIKYSRNRVIYASWNYHHKNRTRPNDESCLNSPHQGSIENLPKKELAFRARGMSVLKTTFGESRKGRVSSNGFLSRKTYSAAWNLVLLWVTHKKTVWETFLRNKRNVKVA